MWFQFSKKYIRTRLYILLLISVVIKKSTIHHHLPIFKNRNLNVEFSTYYWIFPAAAMVFSNKQLLIELQSYYTCVLWACFWIYKVVSVTFVTLSHFSCNFAWLEPWWLPNISLIDWERHIKWLTVRVQNSVPTCPVSYT